MGLWFLLGFTLLSFYPFAGLAEVWTVRYPEPLDEEDHRYIYPVKVLQLISGLAEQKIILKPLKTKANQERNLSLIKHQVVDVFWSGSSIYREQEVHAIRFPIYKGLLGYRLILLKQGNEELLASVKDLEGLKRFSVGQGSGWPEVQLYLDNNFVVHTTTQYPALFEMLEKGRFDIFPRAVIEIWDERDTFNTTFSVDEHILLRYPYATYFFVNKDNTRLAKQLELGFRRAISNGSFDALFEQYNGDYIKRAKLDGRVLIELPNPLFTPVSEEQKSLYYSY